MMTDNKIVKIDCIESEVELSNERTKLKCNNVLEI